MATLLPTAMLPRDAPAAIVHHAAEDIGWQALGPSLGCTLLAIIIVAARWYTRSRIVRCIGLDDYVILLSITLSCLMTTITGLQVHHGIDSSDAHLPTIAIIKLITVNNALWILTVNTTKVSLLLQYLRVFSNRTTRLLCFLLLATLLPVVCWGVFAGTFMCRPIAALWNPNITGQCLNAKDYWLSVSGLDIGLDFFILALPLPAILGLRLPRKQKFALVLVFALGFFVCVVNIVRLITVLVNSDEGKHVAAALWTIVWSAVEANVGIVCASLLALKPLVVKIWPNLMKEDKGSKGSMRSNLVEDANMSSNIETGTIEAGKRFLRSRSERSSLTRSSKSDDESLANMALSKRNGCDDVVSMAPALPRDVIWERHNCTVERVLGQGWRSEGQDCWSAYHSSSASI